QTSILLRYARVADADGDSLQRQLKNVVQRAKCERYRNVGLSCPLLRIERQRCRLVRQRLRPAAVVFPIHAELQTVRGLLRGHIIGEVETPRECERRLRYSERQTSLRHRD